MVAGGGFYFYYNLQFIKIDKEKKNMREKISLIHTKKSNAIFKNGFNPVLVSIPRLPISIQFIHYPTKDLHQEISKMVPIFIIFLFFTENKRCRTNNNIYPFYDTIIGPYK